LQITFKIEVSNWRS